MLLANLAAGAVLVGLTVSVHGVGLLLLSRGLKRAHVGLEPYRHPALTVTVMSATMLVLAALHSIEIWIWALAFLAVGAIDGLYDALFFSTLSFSTLGAEEISVRPEWGLFGSIEGVNGFLLIGWSTAYLIPAWTRYGPFHGDREF
jgi:hypothetical protein